MKYLQEYDSEEQTVIMVQVENEIGFQVQKGRFSEAAEEKYAEMVPESVNCQGVNWKTAFGEDAPETFYGILLRPCS